MKTMFKLAGALLLLAVIIGIGTDLSKGQSGAIYRQWFRSIVVRDSARVNGTTTINGNLTVNGVLSSTSAVTSDSIASRWIVRDSLHVYKTSTINGAQTVHGAATFNSTITGTSSVRGTAAFTTSAVVKSIYIAGAASTDIFIVTPLAPTSSTAPVADDLLNCIAKTDSLIVLRAAGTTSGLGFNYWRIK